MPFFQPAKTSKQRHRPLRTWRHSSAVPNTPGALNTHACHGTPLPEDEHPSRTPRHLQKASAASDTSPEHQQQREERTTPPAPTANSEDLSTATKHIHKV
ncbi:Hypothetical predicted protein, partial [Pelobates cultripes]